MSYTPYSEDSTHPSLTASRPSRFSATSVTFTLLFIGVVVIGTLSAFAIASAFPHQMRRFLLSVDQFGLTSIGEYELQRIAAIKRLQVTNEEKQVLVDRTVFFGATRDMVRLALGEPACTNQLAATASQPASEQWIYFIDDDAKPTHLLFQGNTLASAGKASALHSCER